MPGYAIGRIPVRYGVIEWVKIDRNFILLLLVTFFLCLGIYNGGGDGHWHGNTTELRDNQPTVATVSGGFVGISHKVLDNSNTVKVVKQSTVPMDVEVKVKDGRDLFTYRGLKPGESINFKYAEPCTVTGSASCEQGIDTSD